MIKGIKHIIFDLGGVILNIDYNLTEKAFIDIGVGNFADIYSQLQQTSLFDEFEKGHIGTDEFVAALKKAAPDNVSEAQIIHAWKAMLLDFPLRRLQVLQQLRLHYDLFLLSNTNEIHEEEFNKILMESNGIPNIGTFFDRVYYSHRVGLRKPMKEIFELVLDENSLDPAHTLFIDDSPQHIQAAKALGIQTIFMEKGMTIEENIFLPKKAI